VANVLHRLGEEDYQTVLPLLQEDPNAHVRAAAQRGLIRRQKQKRHAGHVTRVMDEVVKLSKEFAGPVPEKPRCATVLAGIAREPVTLDEFMERFCVPARDIAMKRRRILSAARNRTIKLPPLARAAHQGRRYYFQIEKLVEYWPHWLEKGLLLPDLLQPYQSLAG
jgi:hypothetical protein